MKDHLLSTTRSVARLRIGNKRAGSGVSTTLQFCREMASSTTTRVLQDSTCAPYSICTPLRTCASPWSMQVSRQGFKVSRHSARGSACEWQIIINASSVPVFRKWWYRVALNASQDRCTAACAQNRRWNRLTDNCHVRMAVRVSSTLSAETECRMRSARQLHSLQLKANRQLALD